MFHRNLGLKVIAFVLALALWGWVLVNQQNISSARTVPVMVRTAGALPAGVRLTSIEVVPPVVTVAGPEDKVTAIDAIATVDLHLDQLTTDTTQRLALLCPKGTRLLRDSDAKVTVRLRPAPGQ